ncbi:MAG: hypothetical protein LBL62_02110, partial [Planctomycetaceae bacterium]|nr:hypothetical protein [Planctomycetaceae bacterium]
ISIDFYVRFVVNIFVPNQESSFHKLKKERSKQEGEMRQHSDHCRQLVENIHQQISLGELK